MRELIRPGDRILCADGGADHAAALGITPHVVIGDMDSISPESLARLEPEATELVRLPGDKDKLDLEAAVEKAIHTGADRILIIAAFGGRLDHTFANVLLLCKPEWNHIEFTFADGRQRAWLLRGPEEILIEGDVGDVFSLVPLTRIEGVKSNGLAWPLRDAYDFGSALTISNRLTRRKAEVSIEAGTALATKIP